MWDRIDSLLERAPHTTALRFHRLELLEARRLRVAGEDPAPELVGAETMAAAVELAVAPLLSRVRAAHDGRLVLVKGPEVALDYDGPRLRRFGDLDLLTDDAPAAQAALLRAGFQEVGDPALYEDIHHLRPLWWPGLALIVELHSRPKWPAGLVAPPTGELLAAAVPGRLGVEGIQTLPPDHHALLLAAHAWSHEPLQRVGHLIDVAVTARRTDAAQIGALARRWGCARMWRTTRAAVAAVVDGDGRSAGAAIWGRHLRTVRERTVFEAHLQAWLAPLWGLPPRSVPHALAGAAVDEGRREDSEPWRAKLSRARLAVANAGMPQSEHDTALEARGHTPRGETETA